MASHEERRASHLSIPFQVVKFASAFQRSCCGARMVVVRLKAQRFPQAVYIVSRTLRARFVTSSSCSKRASESSAGRLDATLSNARSAMRVERARSQISGSIESISMMLPIGVLAGMVIAVIRLAIFDTVSDNGSLTLMQAKIDRASGYCVLWCMFTQ